MPHNKRSALFNPHETIWADRLAGRRLAPFGRRAGAFAADLVVALITFAPIVFLRHTIWPAGDGGRVVIALNLHDLWSLVWIMVYFGGATWLWNGRTPGKRLFCIRVVSVVGPKVTLWQAVERSLGYAASALEAGFGFVQFFIARNRQCVHDRIAETIVVMDKQWIGGALNGDWAQADVKS